MAYKPQLLAPSEGGTGAANTATSGKVLIGNGTNFVSSTPTYPNASATSGKVLISDGTNFVASTPTYPNTGGTSGFFLQSDGTNFVQGNLRYVTKQLTSAQIKLLHATPIEIIPAPGLGKVAIVVNSMGKMTYGGSNVFVAGAAQSVQLAYGTATTAHSNVVTNASIVAAASNYCYGQALSTNANIAIASLENVAINLYNSVATEISGNAAGDNTITVACLFYITSI